MNNNIDLDRLLEELVASDEALNEVDAPYAYGLLLTLAIAGANLFGGAHNTQHRGSKNIPARITQPEKHKQRDNPALDIAVDKLSREQPVEPEVQQPKVQPKVQAGAVDIDNPVELRKFVKEESERQGVPFNIVDAIIQTEAHADSTDAYTRKHFTAVSPAGAAGIMQLMPKTAKHLGLNAQDVKDPLKCAPAGIKYIKYLLKKFGPGVEVTSGSYIVKGSVGLFASAYNGGEGNTRKAIAAGKAIYGATETKNYVKNMIKLTNTKIFKPQLNESLDLSFDNIV